jgi:maltooligosyltrehalose trehalohydrolase
MQFLSQFPCLGRPETRRLHADPGDPASFQRCKLDFAERRTHAHAYDLHKDLLRLRRDDPVFRAQKRGAVDGAVLAGEAFVLRFFGGAGDDRLLIVNLGLDLRLEPAPEPLLAPPENRLWALAWSSEHPRYGGIGTPEPDGPAGWRVPGHSAIVMRPTEVRSPWQI